MENERRDLKITFGKSGSGSISPRLSLPKKFLDALEISQESRDIIVELDKEKERLIIKKKK